jgi:hypothetical protein
MILWPDQYPVITQKKQFSDQSGEPCSPEPNARLSPRYLHPSHIVVVLGEVFFGFSNGNKEFINVDDFISMHIAQIAQYLSQIEP